MLRRAVLLSLAALAVAACGQPSGPKKTGPAVAKGNNGIVITADEFKARIDEQSPFLRARYTTLDRKKEFLENLIKMEVLGREAEKQGLDKDPEVQATLRKIMVQKLVQKNFQADPNAAAAVPEAELQAYYDGHKSEYFRPKRVRLSAVVWNAPAGSPDRAKKKALAQKALAKLRDTEKKNTLAFSAVVTEFSEDAATKASGGDLGFKSAEDMTLAYGKDFQAAVAALKPNDTSGVIETPNAILIVKVTGVQEEMNRTFDQVKQQIANKLAREKKAKEFDAWLKKLRDDAQITVDEAALEKVEIAAAPAGGNGFGGGMPGMPPHGPGGPGGGPMVMPPPAPAAPAPAPAPASK